MDGILFLAFTTGFLGGFGHCIGMCGPLVAASALPQRICKGGSPLLQIHLLFSAGRITTYAFLGSLMGLSGTFVDTVGRLAGMQNLVALLVGFFMIAAGCHIMGILKVTGLTKRHSDGILQAAGYILADEADESVWKYYPLGILMGFLPCGLSYTVLIGAAGTGGLLPGMAMLICFGLGTVPAMLLFGTLLSWLGSKNRERFARVGGCIVVMMGVCFIVKGIGLYA
ncbi:MAG: sulfite exporter TauE/SafE family protein [Syntrophales bacterium]